MERVQPSRVGSALSIAALMAGAMASGLSFLSTPKSRRHSRTTRPHGPGSDYGTSRLGHGGPGKINFRRSDPRHPMYDPLRALGYKLEATVVRVGEAPRDDGETFNWVVLQTVPAVHATHDKLPYSMLARDAFRHEHLPIPKCLRVIR